MVYIINKSLKKIITVESRATLLSNDLKQHLFNLFASWSGPTAKLLVFSHSGLSGVGASYAIGITTTNSSSNNIGIGGTTASGTNTSIGSISVEEEKLQFGALQVRTCFSFLLLYTTSVYLLPFSIVSLFSMLRP